MTRDREEQIIKASQLYAKPLQKPFMDGAMWADSHPQEGLIRKERNSQWISIEDWNCMSHLQYAWNFFVVELVNEIGYMGKHIVCVMDKDGNFHVDCDYSKVINMDKVAAILPIEPFDKNLKDMEKQQ